MPARAAPPAARRGGPPAGGARAGTRLTPLPANTLAYEDFREAYPGGRVLSRETGVSRAYGRNPYEGYDEAASRPFLFQGAPDPRRTPKGRVVDGRGLAFEPVPAGFRNADLLRV